MTTSPSKRVSQTYISTNGQKESIRVRPTVSAREGSDSMSGPEGNCLVRPMTAVSTTV